MAQAPVLSIQFGTIPRSDQWPTLSDARSSAAQGPVTRIPIGPGQGQPQSKAAVSEASSASPAWRSQPVINSNREGVWGAPSSWAPPHLSHYDSSYHGPAHHPDPASNPPPHRRDEVQQQQHLQQPQRPQHGWDHAVQSVNRLGPSMNTHLPGQGSVGPGGRNCWRPPAQRSSKTAGAAHNGDYLAKGSGASGGPKDSPVSISVTARGSPDWSGVRPRHTGHLAPDPESGPSSGGADMPLDRYAKTFVPQWLKAVNEDSHYQWIPLTTSGESGRMDFVAYAQTVWPVKLWEGLQSGADEEAFQKDRQLISTAAAWLPQGVDGEGEPLESEGDQDAGSPLHGGTSDAQSILAGTDKMLASQDGQLESEPATSPTTASSSAKAEKQPLIKSLPRLQPSSYLQHWQRLLQAESLTREKELSSHAVFAENLSPYSRSGNVSWDSDGLYRLRLPGVREDRPKLTSGSMCHLRVLATADDGRAYEHFGWLHIVFEARIITVRALQGEIIVSCPRLQLLAATFPGVQAAKFNVVFVFDSSLVRDETASVAMLACKLESRTDRSAVALRKWLFPSVASVRSDTAPTAAPLLAQQSLSSRPQQWFEDTLNAEQRAAVMSIVGNEEHRIPFLLSGPPGTGKTMTSVETILQILQRSLKNRVLVVAPSNAASDVLAMRLSAHLAPGQMYRLNAPTRTFAEVPSKLNAYTYVDEEKREFSLPPWRSLMKARVVVTACHDVPLLINSRVGSNIDLGRLQATYLPGLQPDRETAIELHWTHLLVDEAAQGTEPDLAPALACVLPHPMCTATPAIILVGDAAQLGPAIKNDMCRSEGLDISLFERLSRLPVYSQSLARLKRHGRSIVLSGGSNSGPTTRSEPELSTHSGHLIRNYRARHPALLHLPSTLFYSDSLVPCAPATVRLVDLLTNWSQLPHRGALRGMPMLFADVRSHEEWVDEGVSWWNEGEVRKIVELCRSLIGPMDRLPSKNKLRSPQNGEPIVKPSEIAVISPFREQVWRLRVALRAAGLGDVAVGPVEAYQGQEAPIVILSPVRSRSRFLASDRQAGQGLVCEAKRLNVALTRARELLIVVGNAELLSTHCESWRRVVGHARRNGWLIEAKTARDPVSSGQESAVAGKKEAAQEEISALESAEASISGSWWRKMAGSLLPDTEEIAGCGRVEGEEESGDGLGLLAGRMATVALQADEEDVTVEEDESHDDTTVHW